MKLKIDYFSKSLLLLLFAMAFSSFAFGQRSISGTITDAETGEPLIGANILVVGTSSGTITDIDGNFELNLPEGYNTIEVSYTGYAAQTIEVGASNVLNLSLSPGSVLDEVVVVGYGTQKAKEVTSAVASIKAEDFNAGNVNDPLTLIQGKVAGLSISKIGGDPNGSSTIRLRGLSTLGANTSPLVVIDGVIGASLQTVDPNDIESIDVLKDGSAAAIYGSRASSGVILITTKKGADGQATAEYNGFVTTESIAKKVPTMSAAEFATFRPDFDRGFDTDWIGEVTRNAISHVHNLSLSGGFGNTSYRAAFNFRDIEGVSIVTGFEQVNGRLNFSQKALNDRLKLSLNVAANERSSNFGFNEAFRYATTYNPTAPVLFSDVNHPLYDKYGGYYQEENFDFFNPLAILEQGQNIGELKDLLVNVRGDLEIVEGLTGSVSYSIQRESDIFGEYYNKQAYFRGFNRNGLAKRFTEDRNTELFEATGNYSNRINKLEYSLLAGYSYQDFITENFEAEAGDFISDALTFNNLNIAQDFPNARATVRSNKNSYKVIAFFGRLNLNYDDTYYLSASLRQEGSTRFGENNRWGLFPAVSGGITLSNLFDIGGVDNLKLRVGYGETGALPPESYLSLLRFVQQGSFFYNGGFVPAFGPDRNANPNLKWETKGELDIGLDFALLDYKLTGTVDYYNRQTRDLIYNVNVPVPPNLADRTWANLEDVELKNTGVEVSLGYAFGGNDRNFSWEPRLVFSTFKTTLDTVAIDGEAEFQFFQSGGVFFDFLTSPGAPGLNNNPTIAVFAGEELGQIWGPAFVGVSEDGKFIFEDVNGDGTTDADGDGVTDEADKRVIGRGLPKYSLGFSSAFTFGKFDFNFFLRGDFGHDLANFYRTFYEPLGTGSREIENIVKTDYFIDNLTDAPEFSSYYVEDASYIALDNATLGYTFDLGNTNWINKLRLYVTGQNLFYITDYTGVDPSVRYADPGSADNGGRPSREFNPDPLAPGLDRRSIYFRTRSFTFGINVGF
ncbi:MAG: SusC/RagA family TonB-linked outer membrane protein [Saprospiraceae bacterium]|nr:SusC/RagA family TonB-linked outer membrane protein [Saprospiraceae bacterium]MCB0623933.1 SusC/RagA family TonB-linked outer membrane protein [Saprospiraceae bacterium]MCB0681572.1 SusC/RagA family TonB-linked outer membrane protein [Saprospiraceae bacterium]